MTTSGMPVMTISKGAAPAASPPAWRKASTAMTSIDQPVKSADETREELRLLLIDLEFAREADWLRLGLQVRDILADPETRVLCPAETYMFCKLISDKAQPLLELDSIPNIKELREELQRTKDALRQKESEIDSLQHELRKTENASRTPSPTNRD